jgi:activating signal cointegrator 1
MRAISLWQPWATAAAIGAKRNETRHWSTEYRGPLLIHAAKRCNKTEMRQYAADPTWRAALDLVRDEARPLSEVLPLGYVLAVCNLVDCRPSESFTSTIELDSLRRRSEVPYTPGWTERMMGNYEPGRFGWVLADMLAFDTPVPFKGGQSFFDVPLELVAGELARWPGAKRGSKLLARSPGRHIGLALEGF